MPGELLASDRRRALEHALFIALPAIVIVGVCVRMAHGHNFAGDFEHEYAPAVRRFLHGRDPYAPSTSSVAAGEAFPYTAAALLLAMPFALLGSAGALAFTFVTITAAAATLRVLEVRDWRCYGLIYLWAPVVAGWATANFTLLAVLALALVWRDRDRPLRAGLLIAVAVTLKPFVWPIGLWLLATRRYRAAGWALASTVLLNVVAFAAIGGAGQLDSYLRVSREVADHFLPTSYGLAAIATQAGVSLTVALGLSICVACAACAYGVSAGRAANERASLVAFVGVMFLASPILWMHYLAVLLIPLVILHPRLDRVWVVSLALWVGPTGAPTLIENLIVVALVSSIMVALAAASWGERFERAGARPSVRANTDAPQLARHRRVLRYVEASYVASKRSSRWSASRTGTSTSRLPAGDRSRGAVGFLVGDLGRERRRRDSE